MQYDKFIKRVKRLKKKLGGLYRISLKITLQNFENDINPEDELMKWEAMTLGVMRAFKKHPEWTDRIRKEKYYLAVTMLMGILLENSREHTRYVFDKEPNRIKKSIKILTDQLNAN